MPNEPFIATTNEEGVVAIAVPGAGNCVAQDTPSIFDSAGELIAGLVISEASALEDITILEFISSVKLADASAVSPEELNPQASLYALVLIGEAP